MKELIKRNRPIFGMSVDRKKAVDRIHRYSDRILEHLAKCILYGNIRQQDYDHWIEEISTWMDIINRITIKPRDKKLKNSDYQELFSDILGTERIDAESSLWEVYYDLRKLSLPYPELEISEDKISDMFNASNDLIATFAPILSTKNEYTRKDIQDILRDILDPVCLG